MSRHVVNADAAVSVPAARDVAHARGAAADAVAVAVASRKIAARRGHENRLKRKAATMEAFSSFWYVLTSLSTATRRLPR